MNVKFEHLSDIGQVVNEKNNLSRDYDEARERDRVVRSFYNGQPTMTEKEAEEAGREEVTNHMFGYDSIVKKENRIYRIYSGPGGMIEIKIDTGNPDQDLLDSIEMSKDLSKAIKHSGVFASLWKSISGELNITGRAPCTYDSPHGWCPRFSPHLLLPEGSPLAASELTYAFAPTEMTRAQLERLKAASSGKGGMIDEEAVDLLIEKLEEQIEGNVKNETGSDPHGGFEHPKGVLADKAITGRKTTVNVWWYFEIVRTDNGNTVVNGTLFSEALQQPSSGSGENAVIIGHVPEMFDSVEAWMPSMFVLDSEVGGAKTFDTAKGIAMLTYNSDLDTEELVNSMVEGDKAKSLPRVQRDGTGAGNEDEILSWSANEDGLVPEGLKEFRFSGTSQNLLTPIGLLMNNSAKISDGSHSNVGRDQQLRAQAMRSGELADQSDQMRMDDVYSMTDMLLSEIVYRFCLSSTDSKKVRGYEDIAWFRAQMDRKGIPYAALAEKEFGRFKYMTVKARRLSGNGMMAQEQAIAATLLDMQGSFPPQMRPRLLQRAVATITGDADFAEEIAPVSDIIVTQQTTEAENEYDTITRRAALGKTMPTNPTDIDIDHIKSHTKDMEAAVMSHQVRPWGQLDAMAFQLMQQHLELHIANALAHPASNKEVEPYVAFSQQLAAAADGIITQLQEQAAQQQNPLTPKEQAELQLRSREQDRKDQELQLKAIDQAGTQDQRTSRTEIAERNQVLKEGLAIHKVGKDNRDEARKDRESAISALEAINR